jgi:hypothetical protein
LCSEGCGVGVRVSTVAAAGAEALIALPKWLPKDAFEFMLVELLRRGVLKEDFAHTAYATNSYLKVPLRAGLHCGTLRWLAFAVGGGSFGTCAY